MCARGVFKTRCKRVITNEVGKNQSGPTGTLIVETNKLQYRIKGITSQQARTQCARSIKRAPILLNTNLLSANNDRI